MLCDARCQHGLGRACTMGLGMTPGTTGAPSTHVATSRRRAVTSSCTHVGYAHTCIWPQRIHSRRPLSRGRSQACTRKRHDSIEGPRHTCHVVEVLLRAFSGLLGGSGCGRACVGLCHPPPVKAGVERIVVHEAHLSDWQGLISNTSRRIHSQRVCTHRLDASLPRPRVGMLNKRHEGKGGGCPPTTWDSTLMSFVPN
jgi:hypothetical protein